jgi:hypothetical protein
MLGEMRNAYKIVFRKLERDCLGDLGIAFRMTLKCILKK